MARASAGRPFTLSIGRLRACSAVAAPSHPPAPVRVSRRRTGSAGWYRSPSSPHRPSRSTSTSTFSREYTQNAPSAPTFTVTRLAAAAPTPWFTFDTTGGVPPHGNAVRKPGLAPPLAVRFTVTALGEVQPDLGYACRTE